MGTSAIGMIGCAVAYLVPLINPGTKFAAVPAKRRIASFGRGGLSHLASPSSCARRASLSSMRFPETKDFVSFSKIQ